MRNKELLIYKSWNELTKIEKLAAEARLIKGQKKKDCKFGFNSKGEITSVLDYGVLANIFYI